MTIHYTSICSFAENGKVSGDEKMVLNIIMMMMAMIMVFFDVEIFHHITSSYSKLKNCNATWLSVS